MTVEGKEQLLKGNGFKFVRIITLLSPRQSESAAEVCSS